MSERMAERADVVRYLRGRASSMKAEARREDDVCAAEGVASAIAPLVRATAEGIARMANVIERGDHVQPSDPTPETVLRAMLQAYEAAVLDAEVAYWKADALTIAERDADEYRARLAEDITAIRGELAYLLVHGEMDECADWPERIGNDYRARLRGDRAHRREGTRDAPSAVRPTVARRCKGHAGGRRALRTCPRGRRLIVARLDQNFMLPGMIRAAFLWGALLAVEARGEARRWIAALRKADDATGTLHAGIGYRAGRALVATHGRRVAKRMAVRLSREERAIDKAASDRGDRVSGRAAQRLLRDFRRDA